MERFYKTDDIDTQALANSRIAIIGYGSQGRAQALNLRDSGLDVIVGLRPEGATWKQAESEGWHPSTIENAVLQGDVICLMTPDMAQPKIYRDLIQPNLQAGKTLLFAHGFNIHYGTIVAPDDVDVVLVSPKGPGGQLRSLFQQGSGLAALVAIAQDATGTALEKAMSYAWGIGSARVGIMMTTFAEETECDLFSEQVILCGGLIELIKAGWETLVDAGYKPEIAYFECLHEVKLIADMLYDGGITKMHRFVSDTAAYGGVTRGSRVIGQDSKHSMKEILAEIQQGRFAKEWIAEDATGSKTFKQAVSQEIAHPIEQIGKEIRSKFG